MGESSVTRDYSGVSTHELAAIYERHADCDHRTFASRIGMDERDLKKVVVSQKYAFTGLRVADAIIIGLGEHLDTLVDQGELHIIPARNSKNSARQIVEDEIAARAEVRDIPIPSEEEMDKRVDQLLELRRSLVTPSAEQLECLRSDSERSCARLARKRQAEKNAA